MFRQSFLMHPLMHESEQYCWKVLGGGVAQCTAHKMNGNKQRAKTAIVLCSDIFGTVNLRLAPGINLALLNC